jgi:hypothetical protein
VPIGIKVELIGLPSYRVAALDLETLLNPGIQFTGGPGSWGVHSRGVYCLPSQYVKPPVIAYCVFLPSVT